MKIGVITVTYNSKQVIADFLSSLFAQTYQDWHLYVYENGSPNKINNLIDEYGKVKITYVDLGANLGFAKANNIAIHQAIKDGCEAILLVNNDTVFDEHLLSGLVSSMQKQLAFVIAPKILCFPKKNIVWYGGGYFDPRQALKNIHIGMDQLDNGNYDVAGWQDFAPMCCTLIRKEAFEQIGFLDENYFIYYEDADWMYRLKLMGIRIWYEPSFVLYHKVSTLTGGAKSDFTVYHATKSKIYFIKKFYTGCKRFYWLVRYFFGVFIGVGLRRYTMRESITKLRAFLKLPLV